jgi:outer membrane scaffolding protein for murein synthesis (MipA/OmpV family)
LIGAPLLGGTAQAQTLPGDTSGDSFTIGVGGAYMPSYEGSDDYKLSPAAVVRGRVKGFRFWSNGTQLYLDLVPDGGKGVDFSAGPTVGLRFNRTGGIKDPQVKALGELKTAYEVGGFVGISKTGLITSDYDTLGVQVAYVKDVGHAHRSHVITPSISYGTPLSTRTYVSLSLSADFVGDGYASYYFDVSPAGSVASGLPVFSAEGGFKSWGVDLLAVQSLSGDQRQGGLMLALIGSYNRLQNDFSRSPITSVAGSRHQWLAAVGLAYTF